MAATISLKGIDEALANLSYKNPQALKTRLVQTIRQTYKDDKAPSSLDKIDAERIIKALWDTGDDPAAIKARRKNLSSTKSSVNSDLRKLFKKGKNPEGVIIGRDNVFVMSDEAKDKLISTFDAGSGEDPAGALKQIAQSLHAIQKTLAKPDLLDGEGSSEATATLEDLRSTVQQLSQKISEGKKDGKDSGGHIDKPLEGASDRETLPAATGHTGEKIEEKADEYRQAVDKDFEILEEVDDETETIDDDLEVVDEIVEADEPDDDAQTIDDDDDLEDILEAEDDQTGDHVDPSPGDGQAREEGPGGALEGAAQDTGSGTGAASVDDMEAPASSTEDLLDDDMEVVEEIVEADEPDDDAQTSDDDDDLVDILEAEDSVNRDVQDPSLDGPAESVDGDEDVASLQSAEEIGLPAGSLGEMLDLDLDEEPGKARHLAEVFDGYLGTMERFYNQFLLIPEGSYKLGNAVQKKETPPDELVQLPAFYVGKFPVTNALFEVFIEKTGYVTTAEKVGFGTVYYGRLCKEVDEENGVVRFHCNGTVHCKTVEGAFWYQPSGPGSTLHRKRAHPVVQVSLEDAMAFAAWTGKRLPKEDEWEAAARCSQGYIYPWGNEWQDHACNVEDYEVSDTTPVDTFKAFTNELAIVDTLGNVLEWTSDMFPSVGEPSDVSRYYIAKGGSWISGKGIHLCDRFKVKADAPSNILGFRCVAY